MDTIASVIYPRLKNEGPAESGSAGRFSPKILLKCPWAPSKPGEEPENAAGTFGQARKRDIELTQGVSCRFARVGIDNYNVPAKALRQKLHLFQS